MISAIPDGADVGTVIKKINELIVMANDMLEMKDIVGTVVTKSGCCTEEDEHD